MGVELQVRHQLDHIAAYKAAILSTIGDRGHLWDMVDDAGNELYENTIKGTELTNIDTALDNVNFGSALNRLFQMHNTYYQQAAIATGVNSLSTALSYYGFRVHQHANYFYKLATNTNLDLDLVFPAEAILYQLTDSGSPVMVAGETPDFTLYGAGQIAAKNLQTISGSTLSLTANLVRYGDTDATFTVTWTNTTVADTVRVVGRYTTITNAYDPDDDDGVFDFSSTTGVVVGDLMLASGTIGGVVTQQVLEVDAVSSTTLTMKVPGATDAGGVRHAFPIGSTLTLLFKGFSDTTPLVRNSGNSGDEADFYWLEDRTPSLAYP